ncbi:MAG: efflux RND transporter periplasmic adaptor subunit [Bacteroidales bacterium]|jgi:RND family efflux transporter MFP subunit|nr:efflux RND transporter periplasmic adaptor subunit [Bacteroidales bacterium]
MRAIIYSSKLIPIVVSIVFLSCNRPTVPESEQIVRTAKIDTVELCQGEQKSVYPGKIRSDADVNLAFRVAGTIALIPHREGAYVRKGTLIAEIDSRDYRIQLSATEAEYSQIKATADRVVELYKRGSATQSDYEKAVYGLEQITAKYNAHKNQLADTRLTAPFDGYIRRNIHEAGETVGAGMPVISMIGSGDWVLEINLPVRDYARRNDFKQFEANVSVNPDKKLPLELLELSPQGNANQLYKMVFRITKTDSVNLAAGMSAEVTILFHTKEQSLYKIPLSSLFEKDGNTYVWVFLSDDKPLEMRQIEVAEIQKDGFLIVSQGLQSGERVVSAGVHSIKEGMKVKPLPTISNTNAGGLL